MSQQHATTANEFHEALNKKKPTTTNSKPENNKHTTRLAKTAAQNKLKYQASHTIEPLQPQWTPKNNWKHLETIISKTLATCSTKKQSTSNATSKPMRPPNLGLAAGFCLDRVFPSKQHHGVVVVWCCSCYCFCCSYSCSCWFGLLLFIVLVVVLLLLLILKSFFQIGMPLFDSLPFLSWYCCAFGFYFYVSLAQTIYWAAVNRFV